MSCQNKELLWSPFYILTILQGNHLQYDTVFSQYDSLHSVWYVRSSFSVTRSLSCMMQSSFSVTRSLSSVTQSLSSVTRSLYSMTRSLSSGTWFSFSVTRSLSSVTKTVEDTTTTTLLCTHRHYYTRMVYACLDTCCSHFLTIIAGVDLPFMRESELPVCRTRGMNLVAAVLGEVSDPYIKTH